ncbi:hypothetical protein M569_08806, partial [Genlisea aurea]
SWTRPSTAVHRSSPPPKLSLNATSPSFESSAAITLGAATPPLNSSSFPVASSLRVSPSWRPSRLPAVLSSSNTESTARSISPEIL